MSLYTVSEFMQNVLEDIGLMDLPIENKLYDKLVSRMQSSALKTFSIYYPNILKFKFNDTNITDGFELIQNTALGVSYDIPKHIHNGVEILSLIRVDPVGGSCGYNDAYLPSPYSYSADAAILSVADIQLAAAVGRQFSKALTWEYKKTNPNKFKLYNGWLGGTYMAEFATSHDPSLTTIPDTAMSDFKDLVILDLEQYIYNSFKRIQGLDLGIGNIELKVDDWQDAGQQKKELLKEWDNEGSNLDLDYIQYF